MKEEIKKVEENREQELNRIINDERVGLQETRLAQAELKGRQEAQKEFKEAVEKLMEEHIHPNQPKLDYYSKWEAWGCRECYLNRKLKELLKALEEK